MIDFTIKPDDGEPFEVKADSRDVVVWEKLNKGKSIAAALDSYSFTDLYRLAHIAARRQQLYTGSLEEFQETCVLDFETGVEPDPTP